MFNSLSQTISPRATPFITLKKVWKVLADESYDVLKTSRYAETLVALRTVEGEGVLTLSDKTLFLKSNSLLLFRYSRVEHYKTAEKLWNFYWFEFDCNLLNLPEEQLIDIPPDERETQALDFCFFSLPDPDKSAYLSTVFAALLQYWLQDPELSRSDGIRPVIRQSVDYIMNHCNQAIRIADLARTLGMSDRTFRTAFRHYIGKSPQDFISDLKIQTAKELLSTTAMEIKTIALNLGFQNQYYFSNFFKAKTGCSPTDYRNRF